MWNLIEIHDFDNSCIHSEVENIIDPKIKISYGYSRMLENSK